MSHLFPPRLLAAILLVGIFALLHTCAEAQDATGAIRGVVEDPAGARIARARATLIDDAHGFERHATADESGVFSFSQLSPGDYTLRFEAAGMKPWVRAGITVEVSATVEMLLRLEVATAQETISITGEVPIVETQPSAVSQVISSRDIDDLPLNGRRFSDLALLTPGVTQDPRGLTSASNGDLAFGGMRGWQASYLVDGGDNNNAFFAQARGRYRAPYQFSNEVVQEFRVSSNAYGVDLGRAGGGVVNVVTRSGSNTVHGTAFYYVRDSRFNARPAYVDFKPADRQHQFGATLGGPVRRNRAFFFAGFDQHVFDIPMVVRFLNGRSALAPTANDYEQSDYSLVSLTAQVLSKMGGTFRALLAGNAGFAKFDFAVTPRHHVTARVNTSRYWGRNNVFFDPASPVTTFAVSENGEEEVAVETGAISLASAVTSRLTSQFRTQFSRDLQQSFANSEWPRTRLTGVFDGFGRSSILPRRTREHRLHISETLAVDGRRHTFKFGGDMVRTWIHNFFPSLFGGEYLFDDIAVNPWTFEPQPGGMWITPLRAYAHTVPRYYVQNFGNAVSRPDTNEYAAFVQDTIRVTGHLAFTAGVRYDLQDFRTEDLVSNYYFRQSGRVPVDTNNVAPRLGMAASLGHRRPVVIRGGAGLFYTRIPSVYTSTIENENGDRRLHLLLDNADLFDHQWFPQFPNPLVPCGVSASLCMPPAQLRPQMTSEVSAFAASFQTPFVQQASLGVEREIGGHTALNATYLYAHGEHLIRARDANLPAPVPVSYPVFDESGSNVVGYYTVDSFAGVQQTRSAGCSFPPCLMELQRPYPELGEIRLFESAASSVYHGLTVAARRRMRHGWSFRVAYTWAHAIDDGQDALVAGRPATVQNSYAAAQERGASATDQRHRFVAAWIIEPQPFHRDHPVLRALLNDWRLAGLLTLGSGRPLSARIIGDANRDGNDQNDRLPGYRRNAFTGPDYATADLRLARSFFLGAQRRLELLAESFNVINRTNRRVDLTDDGFANSAATFVVGNTVVGNKRYPARFRMIGGFLQPTNAYAPRQVQFSARLRF